MADVAAPVFRRSLRGSIAVAAIVLGCSIGPTEPASSDGALSSQPHVAEESRPASHAELSPSVAASRPTEGHALQRPTRPRVELEAPPPIEPRPVATRIARQLLEIKAAPDHAAPLRGRIPMAAAFEVYKFVEGPRCEGRGWADVGNGGFVCLEQSRPATDREPKAQPNLRDRGLVPYHYAKVMKGSVARRWRSLQDFERSAPHMDELVVGHDYAFVSRRRRGDARVLVDERGRVVLEREVHRYRPSTFSGRNLETDPVPADKVLAWTVTWPENPLRAEPDPAAPVIASLDYHLELVVDPPVEAEGGRWFRTGEGWLHERHVRRFASGEPVSDRSTDEIWVDVDLDQQTLAVMRGSTPVFATLVSTGAKGPTPRGLFRIRLKQALGDMSSAPGADKPYTVEAVPFVQYFVGGFALHAAYWHNRFGHPISHGCVNLSPADSKTVFELTGPRLPGGWLHAYETEANPGTTVRVRRGATPVEDKRRAVEPVFTFPS